MKRSEMLLNIASVLVDERTNFMSFDKAQELAELILNRMEETGMNPPTITILKDCYNRAEGHMGYEVNEWEEE